MNGKIKRALTGELFVGGVLVALATVCFGIISYLVLLVGSRILSPSDLARFVTIWAVVNTVILALVVPLDGFAPRLRLEIARAGLPEQDVRRFANLYAGLVFGTGVLVLGSIDLAGFMNLAVTETASIGLFVLAVAFSAGLKAEAGSRGRFDLVFRQALAALVVSLIGFLLILLSNRPSAPLLLSVVTLAYAASWGVLAFAKRPIEADGNQPLLRSLSMIKSNTSVSRVMPSLVVVTLLTLLLSNGALMFASVIGALDREVVVYAAMLNLALIPCTLLNALTPPIHIRTVESIRAGRANDVSRIYRTSFLIYLSAVAVIVIVSGLVGPWSVKVYVGHQFRIGHIESAGIAAAEAILALAVLPRIFLTAMAETKRMRSYSLVSCLIFFGVLLLPIDPLARMILAPLCAAGVGLLLMHKEVRRAFSRL